MNAISTAEFPETASKNTPEDRPSILIADDDSQLAEGLQSVLEIEGFQVFLAANGEEALEKSRKFFPDAALIDVRMPGNENLGLLQRLLEIDSQMPIIFITGYATVSAAVEAIQHGAHDFIEKPLRKATLLPRIQKAIESKKIHREMRRLREEIQQLKSPPIIGRSFPIRKILQQIAAVAATPQTTVLIQGQSGTGKELVARAIHDASSRREKPFLAINCAALTESLLEAELFGYEKGSFTGASSAGKQGLLCAADGGTVFLDEISELALGLQAKLLRALQERTIRRVGGERDVAIDVRVVASTNRDLAAAVSGGNFRQDLFFRLHVMSIEVDPLKNRKEDLPLLAHYFLENYNRELGKGIRGFSAEVMEALFDYSWPGNVRELRNTIERAAIVATGPLIQKQDILLKFADVKEEATQESDPPSADCSIKTMEKLLIERVLQNTRGNISRSAEVLGINRTTLYNKMKVYALKVS